MIKKIVLMGNPNVGKSVVFSRLTGANVISSNYPGTTIDFSKGKMKLDGESVNIIDALLVAQYYVGLNPAGFDLSKGDVNCDGSVDIIDALLISQYYVGLITSFC